IAHDFNNILSGILGTASLIKNKIKLNKKIKEEKLIEYINTIEKSGNRAADLVQQLLTVSSKQELSLNPIDLNVAIIHILKVAQNSFDKSIDLRPVYYPEKAIVKADLTQIEQVILNLCVNAAHSMTIMRAKNEKWGGALDIQIDKVYSDHHFIKNHPEAKNIDYWILSIRDTGIGIRKEQLAKIFTPFFTTKDKGKGTGLGLSMVYNIINQHNGFIDIYSEEGIGTTFDIYLPVLKDEEFYEQKPVSEEKIPKGEGLILIIDDEDILRETAKIILNECGYETIFATNGIEGLEIFKEQIEDIKIVLLDMVMPKMSGKETYIELKKIKKDVKVLLVSGFKQDERVQSVLKLGINGFVQKPYTMEKLASAINTIIVN
ncbi:MAG: response regulator, partial [Calditrichia bacterium]|nr:response regulator [Calditrichia bacterium]